MTNYTTTKFMSYGGFVIASTIAILAICLNRDLMGAGILCSPFCALTGVHGLRKALGKEGRECDKPNE